MGFVPINDDLATIRTPLGADQAPGPRRIEREESVFMPAWRTQNLIGSAYAAETYPGKYKAEPNHDPLSIIKGTKYEENNLFDFVGSDSEAETRARMRQIDRENKDRERLDGEGWGGLIAQVAAGTIDPTIAFPGGSLVRSVKGGYSALKSMANIGFSGAAAVAAQEAGLHSTQYTRTLGESIGNIASATILAGLLGAGASRFASAAERAAGIKALDQIKAELNPPRAPDGGAATGLAAAGGAAAADTRELVPTAMVPAFVGRAYDRSRALLERAGELPGVRAIPGVRQAVGLAGKAVSGVLGVPEWLIKRSGPLTRMAYSESTVGKRAMVDLVESPIEYRDNQAGVPTARNGPAVETTARVAIDGARWKITQELDRLYQDYYFGAGKVPAFGKARARLDQARGATEGRMTFKEFKGAVRDAMIRNDTHEVPAVQEAAQWLRKEIFDPWKEAAIRLKLLPEDVTVKTAESYFMRVYDKQKIVAQRPEFTRRITDWLTQDQETKAQLKADLQRNRDLRAERTKALRKLERRLETIARRQDEVEARLGERQMEVDSAQRRVDKLKERQRAVTDELTDLDEVIADLKDTVRNPELKAELQQLERELAQLRRADKPVTLADLERADKEEEAGILSGPMRRAARIATGQVKAPKPPSFLAWMTKEGGIKDVGGDVLATVGDKKKAPGLIRSDNARDLDAWGEKLTQEFPEVFIDRPSPDEILDLIAASAIGDEPQWFVYYKMPTEQREAMEMAAMIQYAADRAGIKLKSPADVAELFRTRDPRDLADLEEQLNGMAEPRAEEFGRRMPATSIQGGTYSYNHLGNFRVGDPRKIGSDAASYVIREGKLANGEAILILGNDGAIHADGTGGATTVGMPPEVVPLLDAAGSDLLVHHNHPSSKSLSAQDIGQLSRAGISVVWAHGNNEKVRYRASLPPALRKFPNNQLFTALWRAHTEANEYVRAALQMAVIEKRLTADIANQIHAHLVTQALHNAGLIDYFSDLDLIVPVLDTPIDMAGIIRGATKKAQFVGEVNLNADALAEARRPGRSARTVRHVGDMGIASPYAGGPPGHGVHALGNDRGRAGGDRAQKGRGKPEQLRLPGFEERGNYTPEQLRAAIDAARRQGFEETAYHGSPVRGFQRFTTDKIGTGEGAQAFGWGLYFANDKKIAEFYRNRLSGDEGVDVQVFGVPGEDWLSSAADRISYNAVLTIMLQGGVDQAVKWMKSELGRTGIPQRVIDFDQKVLDWIEANRSEIKVSDRKGGLYTVDIPDKSELMDWSGKLADQPEGVKAKLDKVGKSALTDEIMIDGKTMLAWEMQLHNQARKNFTQDPPQEGLDKLREILLKARDRDEAINGWRVVGPEWLKPGMKPVIEALAKAEVKFERFDINKAGELTGEQFYRYLAERAGSDKTASEILKAAGIPGHRFPDSNSRIADSTKPRSDNYVIYDDNRINITGMEEDGPGYGGATDTPQFKQWFGSSKVVDDAGKPRVMYHGTRKDFKQFKSSKGRYGREAFFFTDNPGLAAQYGNSIMPVYLKAEKPFDWEDPAHLAMAKKALEKWDDFEPWMLKELEDGDWEELERAPIQEMIRREGFDSFYVNDHPGKALAVFEPTQIKSVFNKGKFDPNNPNMLAEDEPGYDRALPPNRDPAIPIRVQSESMESAVNVRRETIDKLKAEIERFKGFRQTAENRAGREGARAGEAELRLRQSIGGGTAKDGTVTRGRRGVLQDRSARLDTAREIMGRARANVQAELDDLRLAAEDKLLQWEGKSAGDAKAALKRRDEEERIRDLKKEAGVYNGKDERLTSADRSVDAAIKRIIRSDRDKMPAEIESLANEIVDRIIGSPDGRLPYDIPTGGPQVGPPRDGPPPRGPLAHREFMIPDEMIKDWLSDDVEQVAHTYLGSMVPDVLLTERFGDVDMTQTFRQINEEYNAKVKASTSERERIALRKEQERVIGDLAAMRDRIRGTYGITSDTVMRNAARIAGAAGSLNTLADMGGSALSQLPDLAGPIFRHGFGTVFRDGWVPFFKNLSQQGKGAVGKAKRQYNAMGIAIDMVHNTRNLDEVGEQYHPRTKGERMLKGGAQAFMNVNLSAPMTDAAKTIAAVVAGNEIFRATKAVAEGKATARQITDLAAASIDEEMAGRIWQSFQESGAVEDGVFLPNTAEWSDAGARRAFEGAVSREANITVVTPGQEKALWLSNPVLKILGQFKAFIASSSVRIAAANLQRRDAAALQGVIGSIALGMLGYKAYTMATGQPTSDRWEDWVKEGISRAGVLGWIDEGNSFASKFTRGQLDLYRAVGADKPLTRYASRGVLGALLGPTAGKIENAAQVAGALASDDFSAADTRAARRLMPLQNLFYIRQLLNQVESGFNDRFGIPERRQQ